MMISLCCHLSWENDGSGRRGNGGVGRSSRVETAKLLDRIQSVVNIHKGHIILLLAFGFLWNNMCGDNGRGRAGEENKNN